MAMYYVNYYLFIFGVEEPQIPSPLPRYTGCCCLGAKALHDLPAVLVGDCALSARDLGFTFPQQCTLPPPAA